MAFLHLIGALLLFASVVLLVLISVSTPVWNSIYLMKFTIAQASGSIMAGSGKMGIWGICAGNVCTRARPGFDVDFFTGVNASNKTTLHNLTYAMLLNPIGGAVALFALLFSLSSHFVMGVLASFFSLAAFCITAAALGVDVGIVVTARRRLNALGAGNSGSFGFGLWLVAAAAFCQLLAMFLVCCTHAKNRRKAKRDQETDWESRLMQVNGGSSTYGGRRDSTYGGNRESTYEGNRESTYGGDRQSQNGHDYSQSQNGNHVRSPSQATHVRSPSQATHHTHGPSHGHLHTDGQYFEDDKTSRSYLGGKEEIPPPTRY